MSDVSIHWFRKGNRLHDNPALLDACKSAKQVYPLYILDPFFAQPSLIGVNRYRFLLQTIEDLDQNLRKIGSRLFVIQGKPDEVFPKLFKDWKVTKLTFESDTEPYARKRDHGICQLASKHKIKVSTFPTHTMLDPDLLMQKAKGKAPTAYGSFLKVFAGAGPVPECVETATEKHIPKDQSGISDKEMRVPPIEELGYPSATHPTVYPGGESHALERLHKHLENKKWIAEFEKPSTPPNSLEASTTVLSPYIKHGALSSRLFYHELLKIYKTIKKHSQPPMSLVGQLLWREFFYLSGYSVKNYDKMVGNPICKQIPWSNNPELLLAWKEARTGYPFIDACMVQLRDEGWIHHLARHSLACFLTRGDLWQNWEEGAKVFELYLLDADWSVNTGNWLWLSASAFFYKFFSAGLLTSSHMSHVHYLRLIRNMYGQIGQSLLLGRSPSLAISNYRVYSPVAFGKKTDKTGSYIRKYLPQLAKFPTEYIYEPHKAPRKVQEDCACIIGKDYPAPIVDHAEVSKLNMSKMKQAYDLNKQGTKLEDMYQEVGGKAPDGSEQVQEQKPGSPKAKGGKQPATQSKGKKRAADKDLSEFFDKSPKKTRGRAGKDKEAKRA